MKQLWLALCVFALPALAADIEPRPGWALYPTNKTYDTLVADTIAAVKANGMVVVTQAGPTKAAAARGITIPGNRVIGVFNNDYAVRILEQSVPAMIEAPIRMYVTENGDGTATLSYKEPSMVFAPYADGTDDLLDIAADLDTTFHSIAETAAK